MILDGRLQGAAGEDDLLAYYLGHLNAANEHDFAVPPGVGQFIIDEGHWANFERSPQRRARIEADKISYSWDDLIQSFSGHMFAGTQHYASPQHGPRDGEKILRFLAREPRTRRRMLARAVHDLIARTPEGNLRAVRVVPPSRRGDPHYVFLLLAQPSFASSYEEYREVRLQLLLNYCQAVKLKAPMAKDIVGIATEPGWGEERSEDAVYFNAHVFTEQDRKKAQSVVDELGLLKKIRKFSGVEREYPQPKPRRPPGAPMKGRERNARCPCGSGRKFKKCCGR